MGEVPSHLDLTVGQEYTLVLPGLGTAGYIWQERVSGPPGVVQVSWSRGFAPGKEPTAVGLSAPETATIRAVGTGDVTLVFDQVRPWEKDMAPLSQQRVSLHVSPAGQPGR